MKKREITNNDLEQMFNNIIEQDPLVSEEQINSLLNNLPKSNSGSAGKNYFQHHLNSFLLISGIALIVVSSFLWIISDNHSEETIIQNNAKKNLFASVPADTITLEPANILDKEINQNIANEDSVLKESTTKTSFAVVQAETTVSLSDIYKHFDKKPQIFSIQANRDTTIICKEGTTIKIDANSFVVEKTGSEIAGNIQIAVKEFYKMSDIILSNITTTSGDKILETGGMIHISASADNENCMIKPGNNIEIGFPYSNKKEYMDLFYGEQTNNRIDWKLAKKDDVQDVLFIVDSEPEQEKQVFFIVEDMPEFPGGEKALQQYLEQNVTYPYSALKDKKEGKVNVTFVIDKKGNIRNISVAKSLDKKLDKVAVYAVSNLPRWKPGRQRGRPVNVSYTIPVNFSIKKGELTPEEIRRSMELEETLKDFKYDIDANNFYANNKEFDDLEKKVKGDNFQGITASEVNQYLFSSTQLGWINCDRFYQTNGAITNYSIFIEEPEKTIVNLIFHRFKAILPGTIESNRITFKRVPLGEKVTIVALKTIGGKIFLAVKETEISEKVETELDFQQVTLKLLKKEMEKLNKLN